jgi:hypothetical protein
VGKQLVVGAWLYSALALCFSLYAAAPYGKFTDSAETPAPVRSFLGWKISSRLGWLIQGLYLLLLLNFIVQFSII